MVDITSDGIVSPIWNSDGSVTLPWGDGEHTFKLRIGELRELGESINRWRLEYGGKELGPKSLLLALAAGDLWAHEVAAILRLGLIGGGMRPDDAGRLVRRYVDPPLRPAAESQWAASWIIVAAFSGPLGDPVGKPQAETATTTMTDGQPPPPITEPAPPSVSDLETLINSLSGNSPPASTDGTGFTASMTTNHRP